MKRSKQKEIRLPWQPKCWPTWFLVGILSIGVYLSSFKQVRRFGRWISHWMTQMPPIKKRENVVRTNLSLAMPELSEDEREQLVARNLCETGSFFAEVTYLVLRQTPRYIRENTQIRGLDVLERAQSTGKNILLLSIHTTCMETVGVVVASLADIDVIYRTQRNEVVDYLLYRHRKPMFRSLIERDNTEAIIKTCRDPSGKRIVWSIPDQDFGAKRSVFVPFMGCPDAATLTAPARIAKNFDMVPVFLYASFDDAENQWVIEFQDMGDFPSSDTMADACTMNEVFSRAIQRNPDQYYWVHRRFKTLPNGQRRKYK